MVPYSARRKGRFQWRFFIGLSVLGFLIIASAANASEPAAPASPVAISR